MFEIYNILAAIFMILLFHCHSVSPNSDYIIVQSDIAKAYIAAHSYLYDFGSADRGIYTLTLNVKFNKNSAVYIGGKDVETKAKVVSRVTVADVEVGVADRDQTSSSKSIKWVLFHHSR